MYYLEVLEIWIDIGVIQEVQIGRTTMRMSPGTGTTESAKGFSRDPQEAAATSFLLVSMRRVFHEDEIESSERERGHVKCFGNISNSHT